VPTGAVPALQTTSFGSFVGAASMVTVGVGVGSAAGAACWAKLAVAKLSNPPKNSAADVAFFTSTSRSTELSTRLHSGRGVRKSS